MKSQILASSESFYGFLIDGLQEYKVRDFFKASTNLIFVYVYSDFGNHSEGVETVSPSQPPPSMRHRSVT